MDRDLREEVVEEAKQLWIACTQGLLEESGIFGSVFSLFVQCSCKSVPERQCRRLLELLQQKGGEQASISWTKKEHLHRLIEKDHLCDVIFPQAKHLFQSVHLAVM
jgi:hypothetical protein